MKVIEILNFNRELLKRLQASGIRLEDARYIDLYSDYTRLLDQGEKVSYVVAVLSEKYSVSERKVYALVKRFQSDCKIFAVCHKECRFPLSLGSFKFRRRKWL